MDLQNYTNRYDDSDPKRDTDECGGLAANHHLPVFAPPQLKRCEVSARTPFVDARRTQGQHWNDDSSGAVAKHFRDYSYQHFAHEIERHGYL
ncbi:hypothetical protein [Burkholderia sp. LMU1-1-1.1]|uniref:hypothetical protein n=1 Tax=Burkholderia sp. LMU1-1-1.1 TaxID=3135266 RepID=UPI003435D077